MHKLVLFVAVVLVFLRSKSSEAFFKDVDSQRVDASHKHVDAQIKFVAVYEQRVCDVLGDDGYFIQLDFADIVYDVDSSAARQVVRLHDPQLLLFIKLLAEVVELVRDDEGVGDKVKLVFAKLGLHPPHVQCKLVLARQLETLREVVDLLPLIKTFKQILLAVTRSP